jgi:ubiquinone/menaquinone biosynthesis C-methylase UbiE
MGFHTYPVDRADALDDPARFRYVSAEELCSLLGPEPTDTVADLGSGTGFYTDVIAPHVARCYAVDVQGEMHDLYREKGLPANVEPVTANVEDLPFADGALDGAFSTMTYHEFASPAALAELHRVLAPGARLAIADWSAEGAGEDGPPLTERFSLLDATDALEEAGFAVNRADARYETFVLGAVRE